MRSQGDTASSVPEIGGPEPVEAGIRR